MKTFLSRLGQTVRGVRSGFDRLFFRGTLRNLSYPAGLQHYLWANRIPFKDFAEHSETVTGQLLEASLQHAREPGRPIVYLNSHAVELEEEARPIARRDGLRDGLVCVFRRVEPCMSFQIHKDRRLRKLQITYRPRQCLPLYHYQIHPVFGFMHARIQTWFPFAIYVCLHGREWLSRQMDQAGLRYRRRDNCFPWLEDVARAQALLDPQLQAPWLELLGSLAARLNPIHDTIFARYPTHYYWSLAPSEWATDIMFRERADLEAWYPRLVRHGITTSGAGDVLRFLGKRPPASGHWPAFTGEVISDVKECHEGVRLKHRADGNSVKTYDKGSVWRVETTINHPKSFRVYRPKEGAPDGPKAWRPMRRGVADSARRSQVSQAANDRYWEAAAAIADTTPLRPLAEPLCQRAAAPVSTRAKAAGTPQRKVRALNPLSAADTALLEAVARPEFTIHGLRNRDLCRLLFPHPARDLTEQRRRSAAVTRHLRLLRAHHLIHKVPKTHRYVVSPHGRLAITALLAARDANTDFLTTNAA